MSYEEGGVNEDIGCIELDMVADLVVENLVPVFLCDVNFLCSLHAYSDVPFSVNSISLT
jgi:hypothetical protein